MTRSTTQYRPVACLECGTAFLPASSREKFCHWHCRLRSLVKGGAGCCWDWPLSVNAVTGYGQFATHPGKVIGAHRASFEVFHRPLREGEFVCHSCDNRRCVNPAHLFAGTPMDNITDMISKGRQAKTRRLPRGDDHWSRRMPDRVTRKLSDSDIQKIQADPRTHRQIASDWGLSHSSVGRVKRSAGSAAKTEIMGRRA